MQEIKPTRKSRSRGRNLGFNFMTTLHLSRCSLKDIISRVMLITSIKLYL